jgi:hypothetical protein
MNRLYDTRGWQLLLIVIFNMYLLVQIWFEPNSIYTALLLFWTQSILIGAANVIRIFAVKNLAIHSSSNQGYGLFRRLFLAGFFTIHFGFFHLAFLLFILTLRFNNTELSLQPGILLPGIIILAIGTISGLPGSIYRMSQRGAGIAQVMFAPYLRIFPIVVLIIINARYPDFRGIALFVLVKMLAELLLYIFTEGLPAINTRKTR